MSIYCCGGDFQIAGDLPICHASGDLHHYLSIEVREFLPVGCGESLATEGALAVEASKPLDTEWRDVSPVESGTLESPTGD